MKNLKLLVARIRVLGTTVLIKLTYNQVLIQNSFAGCSAMYNFELVKLILVS